MNIAPITLSRQVVRLEPLSLEHVPGLRRVGLDESIWRYMRYGWIQSEAQMRAWVEELLELQQKGSDLPFAVIHLESGQPAGATRYLEINTKEHTLEIGGTWYGLRYQRTAVNTECKYLLLRHAFESLGCMRVQLKTDLRNERSQRAIERLGAVKEGVLRNHMLLPDGSVRDSVYYSIIDREWPEVKRRLEGMLNR